MFWRCGSNYWIISPLSCWINLDATPTSNFQPIRLLDPSCRYKFTYLMANSADLGQLASEEANWSGSSLFAMDGLSGFSRIRINIYIYFFFYRFSFLFFCFTTCHAIFAVLFVLQKYVKIPRKCHTHEAQPSRGTKRRTDEELNIAYSKQSSLPTAVAIRGMLNHNFVDCKFPNCMGEMGQKIYHHLGFLLYNILHHCQGVFKIWRLALIACEKYVMDFLWERKLNGQKREWQAWRCWFYLTQYN